jgi:predicted MFS family arabinose efflux permease
MHESLGSRTVLCAVLAYAASITACNIIPLQVPAFAEVQGLNPEQIGSVAMSEVLGLALTTIFASALPIRLGVIVGLFGAFLVVVAQLVTASAPEFDGLLVIRGLVGVGCGLAAAAVSHTMARSADPAPAFGLANGLSAVMIGALLMGIPWLPSADPGTRVFVPLSALGAVLLVMTYLATRHDQREVQSDLPTYQKVTHGDDSAVASLGISTLLIFIPLGGIWAFSVQIGLDNGLSEKLVGGLLVFAVVGGFVGGNAAAWVDHHVGTLRMVVAAVACSCAACLIVGLVQGAITYAIVFCFYSAVYQYGISTFQIAATSADPTGKLPGILLGLTLVGYALGSYAVGLLINLGFYQTIWVGGGAFCVVAGIPVLLTARRFAAKPVEARSIQRSEPVVADV